MEENQFLYASVPVRMILAGLMGVKVLIGGEALGDQERKRLIMLSMYDGLGAVALGVWLGAFGGRVPGY